MTTRLFKDGDSFGIETDAPDESTFSSQFNAALDGLIREGKYADDWQFQLDGWLPLYANITAKYRGYKADVEQRILYRSGGHFFEAAREHVAAISPPPAETEPAKKNAAKTVSTET